MRPSILSSAYPDSDPRELEKVTSNVRILFRFPSQDFGLPVGLARWKHVNSGNLTRGLIQRMGEMERDLHGISVMLDLPFDSRIHAGRLLGAELVTRKLGEDVIVLALPRGGIPVGAVVAEALKAPLEVVVVRKLGVPWQPEWAMGSLAGGIRTLDNHLISELHISRQEVETVVERETHEWERREQLYRGGRPALRLRSQSVVLVDDGVATGSTMVAAIRYVRTLHPQRVIVAVPVGASEACRRIKQEADCICLAEPEPFYAVGEWYSDFRQVADAEVQKILAAAVRPSSPSLIRGAEQAV